MQIRPILLQIDLPVKKVQSKKYLIFFFLSLTLIVFFI